MYLRISSIGLAFALLGNCSGGPDSPEPQGTSVECAIGAGSEFSKVCILENAGGGEFLVHHPDGGFRRVQYDAESDQLGVGDGADSLKVSDASTAEAVEFAIGEDRYRIPSVNLRAPTE